MAHNKATSFQLAERATMSARQMITMWLQENNITARPTDISQVVTWLTSGMSEKSILINIRSLATR